MSGFCDSPELCIIYYILITTPVTPEREQLELEERVFSTVKVSICEKSEGGERGLREERGGKIELSETATSLVLNAARLFCT